MGNFHHNIRVYGRTALHEMELSFISCPLASSQLPCATNTWCCVYSFEILMMDGKTVRNR